MPWVQRSNVDTRGCVMEPKMSLLAFVLIWAGMVFFSLCVLAAASRVLQVIARVLA